MPRDLTGVSCGHLTYLRDDTTGGDQRRYVVCRCDGPGCGGSEYTVRADNLAGGLTTRCRTCRRHAHDLRGRTFGRLTVVRPLTRRASNQAVVWRCKCECGRSADVSTSNLTTANAAGATRSCGQC